MEIAPLWKHDLRKQNNIGNSYVNEYFPGTLLSKPDLSLGDVALAVGFSDASQLNRVFRKFVGVSPTAYRRDQPWV